MLLVHLLSLVPLISGLHHENERGFCDTRSLSKMAELSNKDEVLKSLTRPKNNDPTVGKESLFWSIYGLISAWADQGSRLPSRDALCDNSRWLHSCYASDPTWKNERWQRKKTSNLCSAWSTLLFLWLGYCHTIKRARWTSTQGINVSTTMFKDTFLLMLAMMCGWVTTVEILIAGITPS